jgi:hypothetical protein
MGAKIAPVFRKTYFLLPVLFIFKKFLQRKNSYIRSMLRLKNSLRRLIDFIIYGNVFIAFCATMSVLSTVVTLTSFVDLKDVELAFFIGAATFFLYNLHKPVTYFLKKQLIDNQRFIQTKHFRGPLSILTILNGFYCFYFFFSLNVPAQILLVLMGILGLGYVLPILKNGKRLRDLAYLKIFLIAIVWSAMTTCLPIISLEISTKNATIYQLFIEKACFILALCIPFDIRDRIWDKATNVKTIPLSFGVRNAKIFSLIALTISMSMVYLLKSSGIFSDWLAIKLAVVYLISAFFIIKTNENRSDYYYYGIIDGMILLQSFVAILG